jgi:hypothetical protein
MSKDRLKLHKAWRRIKELEGFIKTALMNLEHAKQNNISSVCIEVSMELLSEALDRGET